MATSFSLSNLLCNETDTCLTGEEEVDDDPRFLLSENDGKEEYVEELVRRERSGDAVSFCGGCSAVLVVAGGGWIRSARLDAIDWILNTRRVFGFKHQTAYLSICYFDRFLSRRSVDEGKSWPIRLLSVACLSIAAKMEECSVPALSEFPFEDYVFEAKVIMRMELLVLSTLDWKMSLITPFNYLHYFIGKFFGGESRRKGLLSRAVEFLLGVIKDAETSLMDYRPSVIAAAAVLAASDGKLTRNELDLKMGLISSWLSQENESVFSCYNLMQDIEMRKHKTPESVISQSVSLTPSTSTDAVEDSPFASGAGTKRRLSFDDPHQTCLPKGKKRS